MGSIQVPIVTSTAETEDSGTSADVASTAPTTPDGSSTSSPMLRAELAADLERTALPKMVTPAVQDVTRPVRNICCVGAGYVG